MSDAEPAADHSPASSAWAVRAKDRIALLHNRGVKDALEIGRLLCEARDTLPEEFYRAWAADLPFCDRTGRLYKRLWAVFGRLRAEKFSALLLFDLSALHVLAAPDCPPPALAEAVRRAEKGGRVTWTDARELVEYHRPPDDPTTPGRFQDVPADVAQAAAVIRGAQVAALEKAYVDGRLGAVLWRDSDNPELRDHGQEVFAEIQRVLFPEFFNEPSAADSLCPPVGPRRAGPDRLKLFAAKLLGAGKAG